MENPAIETKIITAEPPAASEFLGPVRMVRSLSERRDLISQFTRREVVGRYKGTYLGLIWSFINPLMTLAVYTLVFGVILKVNFGAGFGRSVMDFAVNFYCGLIVYNVFATCVGRAPRLVLENPNYVKKVVFPLEVLPVAILASSLVDAAMGLAILVPVIIIFSPKLSSTMYLFPLVLLPLCALSLGVAWFVASIGVFLRDIGQVVAVFLQLLFFLSPVIYPFSAVPEHLQFLLRLNPLTAILEDARRTLIWGQWPEWGWWAAVTAVSLVVLQLSYMWFMKSKRAFADVV
jgi:lipopolysaccharide transport system permease protein